MRAFPCWLVIFFVAGCTHRAPLRGGPFDDGGPTDDVSVVDDAGPRDGGGSDARSAVDAASTHDAFSPGDAGSSGGGLDPQLDVPPASNPTCTSPSSMSECAGIAVCRFYSATEGRCESCTACGNLYAPCASGDDCDILFVCFRGQCTNFCQLGTSECGAPSDCVNIGHPTEGACVPH
jgi:hypothetical protein